jgi:hypothetical protein
MRRHHDVLFRKYDLYKVVEAQKAEVAKTINALPEQQVLNTPLEDLVERLGRQLAFNIPVLKEADSYVDKEEIEIDVTDDPYRVIFDRSRRVKVRGYRMTMVVPFEGDQEIFYCHPSAYNLNPPLADVEPGLLKISREVEQLDPQQLKAAFDGELGHIKQDLGSVQSSLKPFNDSLPALIRSHVERRRDELKKAQDAMAALGLPVRESPGASRTYAAPEVQRKPAPRLPPTVEPKPLEPALTQEHYEHILRVVRSFSVAMERSPRSFARMDEEELRDQILAHLNGHYGGLATGETFNTTGKTDILIRSQDQNIFVAECKIWEGPAAFAAAIDQLRGYLGWRDRKTALIVFNRRKDFSAVLAKAHQGVLDHPSFKKELPSPLGEGTYRFILKQKDDEGAELAMTLLVFNVPR